MCSEFRKFFRFFVGRIQSGPYKSALIAAPPLLLQAPQQTRAPQWTREFVNLALIDRRNRRRRNKKFRILVFYCGRLLRPPQQPAEGAAEVAPKQVPKQSFLRRNRSAFIRSGFSPGARKKMTQNYLFYIYFKKYVLTTVM